MKKLYLKGVVAMSLSLLQLPLTQAQLVGGDAYLQGTYVEAGLNNAALTLPVYRLLPVMK